MSAPGLKLGTVLRVSAICAAVSLSLASTKRPSYTSNSYPNASAGPPPARAMAPSAAIGLWKTTFGPVKIELNDKQGPGQVRGIWYYKRGNEDVIGDFAGQLRGNVLQFRWREPAKPVNLTGEGYLVFDTRGQRFHGRWWTKSKDRTGTWTGWRHNRTRRPDFGRPPRPDNPYERRPPPPTNPPDDPYNPRRPPDRPPAGTSLPPM